MPTIKDVAEAAEVSPTTVSHVFSNKRTVAEDTRQRVLEVAERLGYRPDAVARSLATGRSTTVGLYFQMGGEALLLNPFFSGLMAGLSMAAVDFGFRFTLLPDQPDALPASARQQLAAAIIVDPLPENRWIGPLSEAGVPIVTIGRFLGATRTNSVDNDHPKAMRDALDHLVEQGYRKPALITVRERLSYMADIEKAFILGCRDLDLDGELLYAADLSDRSGRKTAHELLGRADPPDAIIGAIDHMALGILEAAEDRGIAVPSELGVIGEGDTVLATHAHPPLSSMRVDPAELAREALRICHELWLDPDREIEQVVLPAELVPRASTQRR